jgi:hypothetical protein
MLEELIRHSLTQGVLTRPVAPEDVFAEETLGLTG